MSIPDTLQMYLLGEYEERFGMTFSMAMVSDHNVALVNRLLREALETEKVITDDDIGKPPKGADV